MYLKYNFKLVPTFCIQLNNFKATKKYGKINIAANEKMNRTLLPRE
jgi:hypothetical protein